jgi:hypothetical protein
MIAGSKSEPSPEEEAVRQLGPLAERRLPIGHLDEIAAIVRALDAAWSEAAAPELVAKLRASPGGAPLLSPRVLEEEDLIVLLVSAPAAVCAAFDEHAGRLDSHTEFGR